MQNNNQSVNNVNPHGILDIAAQKIKKHKYIIICFFAAMFIITGGFAFREYLQNRKHQQQWGDLFLAELNFTDSGDNSLKDIEDFVSKNGRTSAGAYGAFMLGNAYYQLKDYTKAEIYFKQAITNGNSDMAALAEVSLIAAQVAGAQHGAAVAQADAFLAKNPAHFAAGQVKQHRALTLDLSGKKPEAKAAYEQLLQEYPGTYYAAFAQLRLDSLK
jgi:predicted negative regulator of RcsB-dependent stress response